MTRHSVLLASAFALAALALPATAQDSFSIDEDAMFGSEDMVDTVTESEAGSAVKSLLVSDAVRIGGRFTGSAASSWTWNDPWEGSFDLTAPDEYGLVPSLSALLFFDARPTEESRFYGSMKTSWPFTTSTSVLDVNDIPTGETVYQPNIRVFELFSDFSWKDSLYFRFGKQTVNWGVGYYFSPANIINLESIDALNPGAQLEGPVALRVLYPIPGTQHNILAYSVFDTTKMMSGEIKPEDTALAAKAEFVLSGWELGIGGYYLKDDPLRGMLTARGSVGNVSIFGEATLSRGSSKKWLDGAMPISYRTDTTSPFFNGTVGFSYMNSENNYSVIGQYLFNGEGYDTEEIAGLIKDVRAKETLIKTILKSITPYIDEDDLFKGFVARNISMSGQHYAVASFSKSELLVEDLSFSLFAIGNLSDFSGYIKPTLSYAFFDGLSLSTSASFAVGYDNGEYVVLNDGQAMSLSISLTLGSGAF